MSWCIRSRSWSKNSTAIWLLDPEGMQWRSSPSSLGEAKGKKRQPAVQTPRVWCEITPSVTLFWLQLKQFRWLLSAFQWWFTRSPQPPGCADRSDRTRPGSAQTAQLSWNVFVSRIFPTSSTLNLIRQPNAHHARLANFTWQKSLVWGWGRGDGGREMGRVTSSLGQL